MNENIIRATDIATLTNWVMIIGVSILIFVAGFEVKRSKKSKTSKFHK
jgi:hypothetical protein